MYCKVHKTQFGCVLAACDEELIGKNIKFGEVDFYIGEAFYKGKKVNEKVLAKLLEEHSNINLVGEKTVAVALEKGLITERSIVKIGNIPHVQIYKL
ncbi:MAG: DUF424 family protein [Candidatus Diapherotrites archaeon]